MSEKFTLKRSGKPPLQFVGDLVASSDGERQGGKEQTRYHNVAVYKAETAWKGEQTPYVVSVEYHTKWKGEAGVDTAWLCDDAADVARLFGEYDPTHAVAGFPEGEAYQDKQDRLLADIKRRYEAQVADVLDCDTFAVTPSEDRQQRHFSREGQEALAALTTTFGYEEHVAVDAALCSWRVELALASEQVESMFDRDDWNFMADAMNKPFVESYLSITNPANAIVAECFDAHRLNGTGYRWFGDNHAAVCLDMLYGKLRKLSHAQAWAVIAAISWFWSHNGIDHEAANWWTVAYRRGYVREGKS